MGWCSATQIFDDMAEFILSTNEPDGKKRAVLGKLIDVLEENDWDCQSDSRYFDHPLVNALFREAHPRWDWSM